MLNVKEKICEGIADWVCLFADIDCHGSRGSEREEKRPGLVRGREG